MPGRFVLIRCLLLVFPFSASQGTCDSSHVACCVAHLQHPRSSFRLSPLVPTTHKLATRKVAVYMEVCERPEVISIVRGMYVDAVLTESKDVSNKKKRGRYNASEITQIHRTGFETTQTPDSICSPYLRPFGAPAHGNAVGTCAANVLHNSLGENAACVALPKEIRFVGVWKQISASAACSLFRIPANTNSPRIPALVPQRMWRIQLGLLPCPEAADQENKKSSGGGL